MSLRSEVAVRRLRQSNASNGSLRFSAWRQSLRPKRPKRRLFLDTAIVAAAAGVTGTHVSIHA